MGRTSLASRSPPRRTGVTPHRVLPGHCGRRGRRLGGHGHGHGQSNTVHRDRPIQYASTARRHCHGHGCLSRWLCGRASHSLEPGRAGAHAQAGPGPCPLSHEFTVTPGTGPGPGVTSTSRISSLRPGSRRGFSAMTIRGRLGRVPDSESSVRRRHSVLCRKS